MRRLILIAAILLFSIVGFAQGFSGQIWELDSTFEIDAMGDGDNTNLYGASIGLARVLFPQPNGFGVVLRVAPGYSRYGSDDDFFLDAEILAELFHGHLQAGLSMRRAYINVRDEADEMGLVVKAAFVKTRRNKHGVLKYLPTVGGTYRLNGSWGLEFGTRIR